MILLDGADLRDYSVEDLRQEIGVIFQDYMRYAMLARENIVLGRIERLEDRERIEQAAARSLVAQVIGRLANGYEQMLGGGSKAARARMSVLISHRFSTVRMADRIAVLEGGAIREEGTHEQLRKLGGKYAELFELQAAGYR